MKSPEGLRYLSKSDVARLLNRCERTVDSLVKAGVLPSIKLGPHKQSPILFDPADVEAAIARFRRSAIGEVATTA